MNGWKQAYKTGAFRITTNKPSHIVSKYAELIAPSTTVLDLGCGAGRNALFLAKRKHKVVAYDTTDLNWYGGVKNVHFKEGAVEELSIKPDTYGAVLLIRLIQYLPYNEVEKLITKSVNSLVQGGLLFLSYSVSGGVHNAKKLEVDTHHHAVKSVVNLIKRVGMQILYENDEIMPQQSVNLNSGMVRAYEMVAQK